MKQTTPRFHAFTAGFAGLYIATVGLGIMATNKESRTALTPPAAAAQGPTFKLSALRGAIMEQGEPVLATYTGVLAADGKVTITGEQQPTGRAVITGWDATVKQADSGFTLEDANRQLQEFAPEIDFN